MDDDTRAAFGRMDRYFELIYGEVRSNGTRLDSVEDRLGGVEGRLGGVEGRLGGVEGRLGAVEGRLGGVEGEVERLSNELRAFRDWVVTQFAELRAELKRFNARLERVERR